MSIKKLSCSRRTRIKWSLKRRFRLQIVQIVTNRRQFAIINDVSEVWLIDDIVQSKTLLQTLICFGYGNRFRLPSIVCLTIAYISVLFQHNSHFFSLCGLYLGSAEAFFLVRDPACFLAIKGLGLLFHQLLPVDREVLEVGIICPITHIAEIVVNEKEKGLRKKWLLTTPCLAKTRTALQKINDNYIMHQACEYPRGYEGTYLTRNGPMSPPSRLFPFILP